MSIITLREEFVRCGRKDCKSCPHGPYRYSYQKINGKLVKKYLGKSCTLNAPATVPAAQIAPARRDVSDESVHALMVLIARHSFVSCRSRYRAALRACVREGDSQQGIELRRLWEAAWGTRR